jgi:glycosyltransferase involved in cell wall biosynthesis
VIVHDGDDDGTKAVLDGFADPRIVRLAGPRRGLGAARNAGLDRAGGDVVCYLDDDNVMHPAWLQAVAHVFGGRDDVDVLYGVSVAQRLVPDAVDGEGWWPTFWQLPWSRETVLEENVTDAGAIAHRRELSGARFDEDLRTGEDWDLLIRLTGERPALAVPAVSHAYAMDAPDPMSRAPHHKSGLDEIRRRHAR